MPFLSSRELHISREAGPALVLQPLGNGAEDTARFAQLWDEMDDAALRFLHPDALPNPNKSWDGMQKHELYAWTLHKEWGDGALGRVDGLVQLRPQQGNPFFPEVGLIIPRLAEHGHGTGRLVWCTVARHAVWRLGSYGLRASTLEVNGQAGASLAAAGFVPTGYGEEAPYRDHDGNARSRMQYWALFARLRKSLELTKPGQPYHELGAAAVRQSYRTYQDAKLPADR